MLPAQKDTRIRCPHCGIRTWMTDFVAFMRDHDRPDGRVCRIAQYFYKEGPKVEYLCIPPEK